MAEENSPVHRSVYLVTYSQASEEWTRESFAEAVVAEFCSTTEGIVKQWVCSKEDHEDGGVHFHLGVKLHRQKRWLQVRNNIASNHGINVNFSDSHSNYFDAWEYCTKEDAHFIQSAEHPDLRAGFVPRTNTAINARRSTSSASNAGGQSQRKRRFDALDLSDVIIAKKIKTKDELLKLANEQRKEGKRDLPLYVLNNIDRCVKLIGTTWEMENVRVESERADKTRMQILRECLDSECVGRCGGQWYELAIETLQKNSLDMGLFAAAIRTLLERGRGKHRNLLLVGPSNCAKSFLLLPIEEVYRSFSNPAQNAFTWIGVEKKEVIFLNDIRWNDKLIPWNNFLQLLEGASVHLSAPKNHSPEDIKLTKDTPIFATSIAKIRKYNAAGCVDEMETEMMDSRWKVFKFTHQYKREEINDTVPPCPRCFARLVLEE